MKQTNIVTTSRWKLPLAGIGAVLAGGALAVAVCFLLIHFIQTTSRHGTLDSQQLLPILFSIGAHIATCLILAGFTWFMLREVRGLQRREEELAVLAMVANKTDHAVFLANPEGQIE